MTLTQLECFVEVSRERHFRRASERLDRTQPAVSLQIQKLEGELGLTLLDRNGARVSLTGSGEMFLPYAERILAESKLAMMRMEGLRTVQPERLRIGALPTVAAHFLPGVLVEFRAALPDVELTLCEDKLSHGLVNKIHNGDLDVVLALDGPAPAGLMSWPLLREEMCLAVSQTHPLASREEVSASELRLEKFITYKSPGHHTRDLTIQMCHAAGFQPRITLESEEVETIQYFVAANLGIAILPEMVLRHVRGQAIRVLRLDADIPHRTITIYQRPDADCVRSLVRFVNIVKETGRTYQSSQPETETAVLVFPKSA